MENIELWDVYDKNRNKLNKNIQRGLELDKNEFHLSVTVLIFNSNGELLIQKRAAEKDKNPNLWTLTAGGSALLGENSQEAIQRELFEELGILIDFKDLRPLITTHYARGFVDIYIINKDINLKDIILQEDEVSDVKWANYEEISKMIDDDLFINYHKSLIKFYFDAQYNHSTRTDE